MEEKSKITGTNGIKIEQQQQPQLPKSFVRCKKGEIAKCVLRCKLSKLRHLVLPEAIDSEYLDSLFPKLVELFDPQPVVYNGGIANIRNWKISCYLEVMDGGIPTAEPNVPLLELFRDLLDACNDLFLFWYRQQHACNYHRGDDNDKNASPPVIQSCRRLMTFITRYTPAPGEQALLKVCMHTYTKILGKYHKSRCCWTYTYVDCLSARGWSRESGRELCHGIAHPVLFRGGWSHILGWWSSSSSRSRNTL
jgi:hypothetical protein